MFEFSEKQKPMFVFEDKAHQVAKIKVIGVGGALQCDQHHDCCNLGGVEFVAANTDMQALTNSRAVVRLQLGEDLTKAWVQALIR